MPLIPFPVGEFGSLNLADDPTEVGMAAAIDMLNVEIPRVRGRFASRAGLAAIATGTASYHRLLGLFSTKTGGNNLSIVAARNTGTVLQLDTVRTDIGTVSSAATTWGDAATFVTDSQVLQIGGSTVVAIASRSVANFTLRGADGTTTGFVGNPRFIKVTPWDDRCVQAHFTSAAGSPTAANGSTSTLFFSDPGAFMTYGTNNWLKIAPDDGEDIGGMVTWRNLLFVIKRRQMFVFYGTSVDSTGNPIFNYRTIPLPALTRETVSYGGENMVAASDGVYLLLSDGVYRTVGDTPVKVSRIIDPIFDTTGPTSLVFPNTGDWTLSYAANRLFLTYPANGTFRTLVFDTTTGDWLPWDLTAGLGVQPTNVLEWPNSTRPVSFVAAGAKVFRIDPTVTTDNGSAIPWVYQTGFSSAGGYFRQRIVSSGERKRHHHVDIHGYATNPITHQVLTINPRIQDIADPGGTVTLGTPPTIARGYRRRGARGTHIAHKLSGSGPAVISGMTYWLAGVGSDT